MFIIDVISRILHVSTAIALVGGSLFTLWVLMPSVSLLGADEHARFAGAIRDRWKRFVHGGIALFLITGFYNYFRAIPLHRGDGLYHALMGIKMLLALVVFFLAAALVGRSAKLEPIRQNRSTWLTALLLVAILIVAISGFLKVRGLLDSPVAPGPVDLAFAERAPYARVGDGGHDEGSSNLSRAATSIWTA